MKKLPLTIKQDLKKAAEQVRPDLSWKNNTKDILLSQLDFQEAAPASKAVLARHFFASTFQQTFSFVSWRSVGVTVVMLAIAIGPGLATVSAARASLPGDALYPLKRSIEKAQVGMSFNSEQKARKGMDFVANRLNELHRITHEHAPSPERQVKIALALVELKENTTSVQAHLETVKNENHVPGDGVVELAKNLEERTIDYKVTLKSAVSGMDDDVAKENNEDIETALMLVQDVAIEALGILVDRQEESGEQVTTEDKEDLNGRIKNQINTTRELIENLADRVDEDPEEETTVEDAEETGDASESSEEEDVASEEDTEEPSEDEDVTDEEASDEEEVELVEEPTEEQLDMKFRLEGELLDHMHYAEELLEIDDFSEALDVLSNTKDQFDEIASKLNEDEEVVEADAEVEEDQTDEAEGEESTTENTEEAEENIEETPEEGESE